ncbi:transposon ty3-I gag-pol polyprotein, partial [Tanacetum coccineum]
AGVESLPVDPFISYGLHILQRTTGNDMRNSSNLVAAGNELLRTIAEKKELIRFIKNYADISQPLTALLKKNAFKWNVTAELAYNQLKKAMMEAPVLALPSFDQEFVVETDASGTGIGAVLCQNGHPIAYLSKTLAAKHQNLSTFEKDLAFLKWLPKLLGYDYEISYKKGNENVVAEVLSKVNQSGELLQLAVSSMTSDVWDKVKDSWKNDIDVQNLIQSLVDHNYKGNKYSWNDGFLKRKGKVVVGGDMALRKELIKYFHDEVVGGHCGVYVTTKKLSAILYWKGLKKMVKQWVRDCDICQRQKPDLSAYPGLIQPLPIPERIWVEVTMDFIEKLLTSNGKSVIMVVVDMLTKYAHFMALSHPFSASQVAQTFPDNVYKLHGLPESIVSDRDKVFMSGICKALFAELKVKLKFSTAYHPQIDGQTKMIEEGTLDHKPMAILERRLGKLNNKPLMYVLTQWVSRPIEEATWEVYGDLITRFLEFERFLEDKEASKGDGVDTR